MYFCKKKKVKVKEIMSILFELLLSETTDYQTDQILKNPFLVVFFTHKLIFCWHVPGLHLYLLEML